MWQHRSWKPPARVALACIPVILILAARGESPGRGPAEAVAGIPSEAEGATYAGQAACAWCHNVAVERFSASPKGKRLLEHPQTALERQGCEACHGPGSEHVAALGRARGDGFVTFARNDPTPVERRNAVCLQCHQGGELLHWQGSAHDLRRSACTDCHSVMTAHSERNLLARPTVLETCAGCHIREVRQHQFSFSRMPVLEGKMTCTNCHNPHGSTSERLLVAATVNEVCFACHAERRGPFLWEHAPVTESCLNCHDPHGSRNGAMLIRPQPRLCQQCHVQSRHPSDPQRVSATRFLMGRQCTNCHTNIHGSNHPSGSRFVR
jgi:DmsE family decaheme c-type cytochrome